MTGTLTIAGLGPGDAALITPEVAAALADATDVVGYTPYVARVAGREGLVLHASDNRQELLRAAEAMRLAATGRRVVVASSGDPGVLAIASRSSPMPSPRLKSVSTRCPCGTPGLTWRTCGRLSSSAIRRHAAPAAGSTPRGARHDQARPIRRRRFPCFVARAMQAGRS